MPLSPTDTLVESELVEEPLLAELVRPAGIDPNDWRQLIALQRRLPAVDTDCERKEHLQATIGLARQLEKILSDKLPSESQQLTAVRSVPSGCQCD